MTFLRLRGAEVEGGGPGFPLLARRPIYLRSTAGRRTVPANVVSGTRDACNAAGPGNRTDERSARLQPTALAGCSLAYAYGRLGSLYREEQQCLVS